MITIGTPQRHPGSRASSRGSTSAPRAPPSPPRSPSGWALRLPSTLWWRSVGEATRASARRWRGRGLRTGWRAVLGLNRDIFLRTAVLYIVLTFMTAYGAHISTDGARRQRDPDAAHAARVATARTATRTPRSRSSAREIGARDVPAFHRAVGAAAAARRGDRRGLHGALRGRGRCVHRASSRRCRTSPLPPRPPCHGSRRCRWSRAAAYLFDGVFLGSGKVRWMLLTMSLAALVFFAVWWLGASGKRPQRSQRQPVARVPRLQRVPRPVPRARLRAPHACACVARRLGSVMTTRRLAA